MLLTRLRFHPIEECSSTVRVSNLTRMLDGNQAVFSFLMKDERG